MVYRTPHFRSSKMFGTRVFWRLRNHTFDGHISGLEQDRDNLKPLLPTNSSMPYRLVLLASRSRDHTTSGLAFWRFRVIQTVGNGTAVMSPVVGHGHSGEKWGPVLGVTALPASTPITLSVEEYPTEKKTPFYRFWTLYIPWGRGPIRK